MRKASRAIIIDGTRMLVMHRKKFTDEYFTLVGGRADSNESLEETLVREVREETGLEVTAARLVFIEEHPAPANEQYIYLCQVSSYESVAIQSYSEEAAMNKLDMNIHALQWIDVRGFAKLSFRTPQLQAAIISGLQKGFPEAPVKL